MNNDINNRKDRAMLIVPTLLDSFDWLCKCPPSWKENAYDGLMNKLKRAQFRPTPIMEKGNQLESYIYKCSAVSDDKLLIAGVGEEIRTSAKMVRGGVFQVKLQLDHIVDGVKYHFFGYADCINYAEKRIVDIKGTGNYRGERKYLGGWQHIMYCLMSDMKEFDYVVNVFKDPDSLDNCKISDVHIIHYSMKDEESEMRKVDDEIRKFIEYLSHDEEMRTAYETVYNKK